MPNRDGARLVAGGGGRQLILPFLAGLVASLPFQKGAPGVLVFFALVPFFLLLRTEGGGRPWGAAFRLGWVFGFGFFLGLLYWIGLLAATEIPVRALALGGLFVLAAYLALFPALFALLARVLTPRLPSLLALPLVWGATEHLRSLGPLGFPWGSLGYALGEYSSLVQLARIGSVDILTWIVVVSNVLLTGSVVAITQNRFRSFVVRFVVVVGLLFLVGVDGVRAIRRGFTPAGAPLRVAVVQPNIAAEEKWTERYKSESIRIMAELMRESVARKEKIDLVVWPETGVPVYVRHEFAYLEELIGLVEETGTPLLFGFPDAEYRYGRGYEYFNAALLLNRYGKVAGEYRKIHLVPFGERLPLDGKVDWISNLDLGEADFTPGKHYTVFPIGFASFSANICFEAIFPPLCRRFVLEGARFLVNLTNDAWFGTTAAPYQHAAMARLRSVELGVFLARSANTGISLIADPFGRVVESLPLFRRGVIVGEIVPTGADTFYARHGDWLPRAELVLSLLLLLFVVVRSFRRPPRSP